MGFLLDIQRLMPQIAEGLKVTLQLFFMTLVLSLPLGLVLSIGRISKIKPLQWIIQFYLLIFRGTPLMLQLFFFYFGLPFIAIKIPFTGAAVKLVLDRYPAALLAFVLNYAAYFAEIFRGGIESIPVGQYEAGKVLGMTKTQVFFKVVLFQVIKRIVAPISNEVITLVKDTSLARVISVPEIIMVAERFSKKGLIGPLFSTGLYFLVFNGILTLLFGYIEKKLDYYKG